MWYSIFGSVPLFSMPEGHQKSMAIRAHHSIVWPIKTQLIWAKYSRQPWGFLVLFARSSKEAYLFEDDEDLSGGWMA